MSGPHVPHVHILNGEFHHYPLEKIFYLNIPIIHALNFNNICITLINLYN